MISWFNWHAPVITPAQGFVAIAAVLALDLIAHLIAKLIRDARKPIDFDPYDKPHGWEEG